MHGHVAVKERKLERKTTPDQLSVSRQVMLSQFGVGCVAIRDGKKRRERIEIDGETAYARSTKKRRTKSEKRERERRRDRGNSAKCFIAIPVLAKVNFYLLTQSPLSLITSLAIHISLIHIPSLQRPLYIPRDSFSSSPSTST